MSRSTNVEQGGSFIHKPARGWLHSDVLIGSEGVTYSLRYVGCLEVNSSMKSLNFETRSHLARECINRVCEAAGLKPAGSESGARARAVERGVSRHIASAPRMEHAGSNVSLTVSSSSLTLVNLDSGQRIATHDMPRVSFASGGDTDTLDFVAYVAKDLNEWRACYVVECGGGLAQDVISTIGQAFELRFKQHQNKPLVLNEIAASGRDPDRDYYNDLPGKVPPDVGPPPVPPLPSIVHSFSTLPNVYTPNLIDLISEPSCDRDRDRGHDYVNDGVVSGAARDVFDMQPFPDENYQRSQLQKEAWFHGSVSRAEAEALVRRDGDFLVRESQANAGQYVLTGMQGSNKKHLLLIDPEGVVRTKDRMFESVSHLINFHSENALPIISAESVLVLRTPVPKSSMNVM